MLARCEKLPIEIFDSNPIENKVVESFDSSASSEVESRTPSRKVPGMAEIAERICSFFYQQFAKKLTRSLVILVVALTQISRQIFEKTQSEV